jgi:hypothetical protein
VPTPPADTSPNAAFIDDPAVVSDKRLDSPPIPFPQLEAPFAFRHNFNLEASSEDSNLGFDGAVLEVSYDGGNTFQYVPPDVFLMGGYNRTISTDRGSPIAGLRAWSGNSQGFITTVVNVFLPIGSKLRWRMASDTSGSNEGWRVDTAYYAGCLPVPRDGDTGPCQPPTPTPTATPTPTVSVTPTVTPTATVTPTPPPTATATPRVTPRQRPTPRVRPTPP